MDFIKQNKLTIAIGICGAIVGAAAIFYSRQRKAQQTTLSESSLIGESLLKVSEELRKEIWARQNKYQYNKVPEQDIPEIVELVSELIKEFRKELAESDLQFCRSAKKNLNFEQYLNVLKSRLKEKKNQSQQIEEIKQELLLGFPFSSQQIPRVRQLLDQNLASKTFGHINQATLKLARQSLQAQVRYIEEHRQDMFGGLNDIWRGWDSDQFRLVSQLLRLLVSVEVAVANKNCRKHYYDIVLALEKYEDELAEQREAIEAAITQIYR